MLLEFISFCILILKKIDEFNQGALTYIPYEYS